jgi:4-hydroxy-3-methylbut-2-en-1-yl diphosphate reductase
MVDNAAEIDPEWVAGKSRIGLTAGASAPEILVREVIERLKQLGVAAVENLDGTPEKVAFALPKGLV